jgi:glycosyltransferase involved in cell wall biosynthesis
MLKPHKSEVLSESMSYPIDILLATYNVEKYLDQQYSEWRLIIRDDESTDSTLQILSKYV